MPCCHPFGVSLPGGAGFPVVFAPLDHRLMANGKNPFGIQMLIAGRSVRTGSQRRLSRKTRQGVLTRIGIRFAPKIMRAERIRFML